MTTVHRSRPPKQLRDSAQAVRAALATVFISSALLLAGSHGDASQATPTNAAPTASTGAPASDCEKRCRRVARNCRQVAQADFTVATRTCTGTTEEITQCENPAREARQDRRRTCRQNRKGACQSCCADGGPGGINACAMKNGVFLPPEPQAEGDPVVGRDNLLNGDFMTCGFPYRLWTYPELRPGLAAAYGGPADGRKIANRTGVNADLPYYLNAFTSPTGAEVLNANCLMCHGGLFDGELVIGLGNPTRNFTAERDAELGPEVGAVFGEALASLTEIESEAFNQFAARGAIVAPATEMRTVGMNPAEILAVVLMVHHDRDTLEWSDKPLTEVVPRDENGVPLGEDAVLTSDPPPWWRVHKKNALFYNGMARGDHRGTMALATSVCVDNVARAQEVDALFTDIQAYIGSLRAPSYTRAIDSELVTLGETVFSRDCAMCHGTYSANEAEETYPNLLIPLDIIGTDPAVANAGVVHTPELVDWYNQSFYGGVTRMEPNSPFPGYMPPPLDGIWATAPFLHNGSVPTLKLVLRSGKRPTFWKRENFDSTHFSERDVGWPWSDVGVPQLEAAEEERKFVYDTTYFSQSNDGHPFGDHLFRRERRALLEYLKTL